MEIAKKFRPRPRRSLLRALQHTQRNGVPISSQTTMGSRFASSTQKAPLEHVQSHVRHRDPTPVNIALVVTQTICALLT